MRRPSLSFELAIVAHPTRQDSAEKLANEVSADRILWDHNGYGCNTNHKRAWSSMGKQAWSVVLEDDAIPVQGFRHQLAEALAVAPTPIISLYLGRDNRADWQTYISRAVNIAAKTSACFITSTNLLHAVAVAIQTDLIPDLLGWRTPLPWDEHITHWANQRDHPISYTHPSLVDHADLPPVITHRRDGMPRTPGRVAWNTGTRDLWTETVVDM